MLLKSVYFNHPKISFYSLKKILNFTTRELNNEFLIKCIIYALFRISMIVPC